MNRLHRVIALALIFYTSLVMATGPAPLPGDAARDLPALDQEITTYWPDLMPRAYVAAIIDQESGWKSHATLKTSRELGCGYGQFTMAYDASGKVRFDALTETKKLDPSLAGWSWKDCYAVQYQLRAVTLKLHVNERNCRGLMSSNMDTKACGAASYNGGFGSVTTRIRNCRMETWCKPAIWADNLEKQCPQANVKVAGYGESFCEINSKYPGRVFARMGKFDVYWKIAPVAKKE